MVKGSVMGVSGAAWRMLNPASILTQSERARDGEKERRRDGDRDGDGEREGGRQRGRDRGRGREV